MSKPKVFSGALAAASGPSENIVWSGVSQLVLDTMKKGFPAAIATIDPTIAGSVLALATVCGVCRRLKGKRDRERDEALHDTCLAYARQAADGAHILQKINDGEIGVELDVLARQDVADAVDAALSGDDSRLRPAIRDEFLDALSEHPLSRQLTSFIDRDEGAWQEAMVLLWTLDHRGRQQEEAIDAVLARLDRVIEAAPSLDAITHQPWLTPSPFPFHYTRTEMQLRGPDHAELLDRTTEFLEQPDRFRWWLWTGLEGAGKSRLAMEACCRADTDVWDARFVRETALRPGTHDEDFWRACHIERDTLLVFDYAGSAPGPIRAALAVFATRFATADDGPRIRILLLERFVGPLRPTAPASQLPQWAVELFHGDTAHLAANAPILNGQYPRPGADSEYIRDFSGDDMLALAREYLAANAPDRPASERDALARRTVDLLGAAARPLHVQLAAHVLLTDDAVGSFEEVMYTFMTRAAARTRENLRGYDEETIQKLLNLLCVATVMRTMRLRDVPQHDRLPDRETLRDERFLSAFGSLSGTGVINGVEPDLVGEWFVRVQTESAADTGHPRGGMTPGVLQEILDDCVDATVRIGDFVQRTYRYFRDEPLWRTLSDGLGRYSTPFGSLFDDPTRQAKLLGGTTRDAETTYHALIERHIEAALASQMRDSAEREVVVVDLMAGGSDRIARLLSRFEDAVQNGRLHVVAIDRDTSRLTDLAVEWRRSLWVIKAEIDRSTDLRALLRSCHLDDTCDLVIAKKALHEISWDDQRALIAGLAAVVRPGGAAVMYADSPDEMTDRGYRRWQRELAILRETLPIEMDTEFDVDDSLRDLAGIPLRPDVASDAALFANIWIKLKDWANFNLHEWSHRYFSSWSQLRDEFANAGFNVETGEVERFTMQLQAVRFVEEAINRIGYLCADKSLSDEDIATAFAENDRYALFRGFAAAHLWEGGEPTPFGAGVGATMPPAFDLDDLIRDQFDGLDRQLDFPSLEGPSFEMPIRVFALAKG